MNIHIQLYPLTLSKHVNVHYRQTFFYFIPFRIAPLGNNALCLKNFDQVATIHLTRCIQTFGFEICNDDPRSCNVEPLRERLNVLKLDPADKDIEKFEFDELILLDDENFECRDDSGTPIFYSL